MSEQQLDLFPVAPVATDDDYHECPHERMMRRAQDPEVLAEILTVFRSRPGEWISGVLACQELYAIRQKYRLGSYFSNAIDNLERQGLLERRHHYHGATTPVGNTPAPGRGRKSRSGEVFVPYLGYSIEHRASMEAAA